jgi:hypothetical protein
VPRKHSARSAGSCTPAGSTSDDGTRPGVLADVALAREHIGAKGWLFAADADTCFQPRFPLQRFIESAVVSSRVTVAVTAAGGDMCAAGAHAHLLGNALLTPVQLDAGHALKLAGVSISAEGAGAMGGVCAMRTVPLVAVPPDAVAAFVEYARADTTAWCGLERFVASASAEQKPVTGFCVPAAFSVRGLRELLFTDRFFHHWGARCAEAEAVRPSRACCLYRAALCCLECAALQSSEKKCACPQSALARCRRMRTDLRHRRPGRHEKSSHVHADLTGAVQENAHTAAAMTGARGTAGADALLGTEPGFAECGPRARHLTVADELAKFVFDEKAALVTRSQLEGASLLLPKRFVHVRSCRQRLKRTTLCSQGTGAR